MDSVTLFTPTFHDKETNFGPYLCIFFKQTPKLLLGGGYIGSAWPN
jgi:hypothetical protein